MAAEPTIQYRFDLDAGHLALNFTNTLEGRYDDQPRDLVTDYDALVAFALESELLDSSTATALIAAAAGNAESAEAALAHGLALREALFHILAALADERAPADNDLAVLNQQLAQALPHGRITQNNEEFIWDWEATTTELTRPLWSIAYAAMDLLLHGPTDRIRECAAHDCGWLFIDTTRNRARRWCSMKSCGNRAKVQHFRERARGE